MLVDFSIDGGCFLEGMMESVFLLEVETEQERRMSEDEGGCTDILE